METQNIVRGGEFLIKKTNPNDIFTPADFSEEDNMFADSCSDFIRTEVMPHLDDIDAQKEGLMESILDKAAELGLFGFSVPEAFGGLEQSLSSTMLITERIGAGHSFAVSFAAHTGIAMAPIIYYGTEAQKQQFLPDLISGKKKGAYCLTEPGAGSDAYSIKTTAKPTEDGKHYILNGQKMWITNGGFAKTFIVFTRITGDKGITAFVVDTDTSEVKIANEEHKMGIKGSSTVQLFFEDCKVPAENLLGEREQGFKIAMNVLNLGRMKLAGAVLGASTATIKNALEYAGQRKQFGKFIHEFGTIKHKLAQQCIKTFAIESALYRTTHLVDVHTKNKLAEGLSYDAASLSAFKEYAVEAALLKVHGSEMLDFVVDEGVQIMGGMGYSTEGPMDRAYRDSRINRIFEGTNEINRLLVVDMMVKRAMKGEIDLLKHAQGVSKELVSLPDFADKPDGILVDEIELVENFKKVSLLIAGAAVQKLMMKLSDEQELIMNISDIISKTYLAESVILRVLKANQSDKELNKELLIKLAKVFVYDTADEIAKYAKDAANSFAEGDELRMINLGIKRFTKTPAVNIKDYRRDIANKMIEEQKYFC